MHINKTKSGVLASIAVLLTVTACGGTGPKAVDQPTGDAALQLDQQRAALEKREQDLRRRELALGQQRTSPTLGAASGNGEMLPPGAKPGQCFTRIWQPPEYKEVSSKKLISEAGEKIDIIPARYGKVKKKLLVEEASTKLVPVPATYKVVKERVLVQPAKTVIETIPAVYDTVTERIIDKPAHTAWKKGTGPIQRIDESTGEIMCLVEIPATYKTIRKEVVKTPARTRERTIPAVYKDIDKRVVVTEATTKTITIPAKYTTVTVTEEIEPAKQKRTVLPEKYATVTQRELVSDGNMQWREILCETNTTPGRVKEIQKALMSAGFNPGPIDGGLGPSTIRAVNAFQRSKGLPVDRYLNVETVRALGVSTK